VLKAGTLAGVGLLSNLRLTAEPQSEVTAAFEPTYSGGFWASLAGESFTNLARALSVPAVSRGRSIICGTVGSLPLYSWQANGQRLAPRPIETQPDPDSPRSVTYAYLAESMLFYGVGYVVVLATNPDGTVRNFRWVDPQRVSPLLDGSGTIVTGYLLGGDSTPNSGVGSIISFINFDRGVLNRAGRTIETAIELEEAANRAAKEPIPSLFLKNKGVALGAVKVKELLDGWKNARRTRSTAYLNADIDPVVVGFSPEQQQLVSARQYHAAEIARALGIPAWYVNAETASMTYSNTEQERRSLIDYSLKPILTAISERLSMADFSPFGVNVRFYLDDFLRGNSEETMRVVTGYINAGVITVDEARRDLDLVRGN